MSYTKIRNWTNESSDGVLFIAFSLVFNRDSSRESNGQASKKGSSLSEEQDSLLKLWYFSIVVPQEVCPVGNSVAKHH